MRSRAAALLTLVAIGVMGVAGRPQSGQATTLQDLLTRVEVTITDERIIIRGPAELQREEFVRGSIGDFRVVNRSSAPRNFAVGVERTGVLEPGERASVELFFPTRGVLPYRVTLNRRAGHSGVLHVF